MVKKPGKPKSKRTPVRLRHKIEKASANKQRKDRKAAKKNPEWRSRLKKDPGIPNLFPYKEKILHEIEEKKRLKEEEHARLREQRRAFEQKVEEEVEPDDGIDEDLDVAGVDGDDVDVEDDDEMQDDSPNPMAALLASARARALEHDLNNAEDDDNDMMDEDDYDQPADSVSWEASRQSHDKIYKQVIHDSDLILYVLDARDPDGLRSRSIEREVMASGDGTKRMILVLNKIDLIPSVVLQRWLSHLRRSFPTFPLRANSSAPNAKIYDHKTLSVKATSETLLRALKSYAQSKNLKRSLTVGILGYPNVGKSSVINALISRLGSSRPTSKTSCPVGAEAGVTTAIREIKLDNKLKLLDSPGIIFPDLPGAANDAAPSTSAALKHLTSKQTREGQLTLLSALPPSSITDPIPAVTILLHKLSSSSPQIEGCLSYYSIPSLGMLVPSSADGDVTTDFLVQVARKRGRLGKGGVPNLHAAAMGVLADWRDGRISGWSEPPDTNDATTTGLGSRGRDEKEVVSEWGAEFKIDGLWADSEGA